MANRSASETAEILEVSRHLNIIQEEYYHLTRDLLTRIVTILTKI